VAGTGVSLAFLVYAFGGVRGAPIGAAERTLDGEDHFETFEEGENSATIPGAKVDRVSWNYRDPLQNRIFWISLVLST